MRIFPDRKLLPAIAWLGLLLFFLGWGMNVLVMHENGGKMPVATCSEEVFVVIGSPMLGTTHFFGDDEFAQDPSHQPMRTDMRYLFLADRIATVPFFRSWSTPLLVFFLPVYFVEEFPVGHESLVSLGDIVSWSGCMLAYIAFVIWPVALIFRHRKG